MELTNILLIVAIVVGILVLAALIYIIYLLISFISTVKKSLKSLDKVYGGFDVLGKTLSKSGERYAKALLKKLKNIKGKKS